MKVGINQAKQALGASGQVLHNWEFNIVKSPVGVQVPLEFLLRLSSSTIPTSETEYVDAELFGHKFTAGSKTLYNGEITLSAYEGIDGRTQDFLKQLEHNSWSQTVQDTFGSSENIEDQKFDATLMLMGGSADAPTRIFTLVGCLMSMTDRGALGQELALQTINVSIRYDTFYESSI